MKRAFTVLGAALQVAGSVTSPPVKVGLRSSWSAPPFLAEILETISLDNPNSFFPLVDRLTNPEVLPNIHKLPPEAVHQGALGVAIDDGIIQQPGDLGIVEMNLAMHAATPKLEAFYNYYEDTHNSSRGRECGSWVDWYGEVVCDVEGLAHLVGTEAIDAKDTPNKQLSAKPKLLTFDHIFPPPSEILERPPRTAILYASLSSPNFRELHSYLYTLVNKPEPHVEYVFRHIPPSNPGEKNYLSGYGVALDLKKKDYLALDDRNLNAGDTTGAGSTSEADGQKERVDPILSLILAHPDNSSAPDANVALTNEEILSLGAKAVQIIAESSDPLSTLTHLSQNFPKYATSLARRVLVNESIGEELHNNSLKVQWGLNVLWLNGQQIDAKDVHPFGLLRLLKKERAVMQSLASQGLQPSQAFHLLTHPAIAAAQKDGGVMDAVFDASDRPEGEDIIVWWNDMEKDKRYASWNPSLYALLRPIYPGAMPSVKANLFNVVLILDLSQMPALNFISGPMQNIISREFPLRFGLVPVAETQDGKKMAKLFYYLIKNYGRKKTLEFLNIISQTQLPVHMQTEKVQWEAVSSAYVRLTESERQEKPSALVPTLASIIGEDAQSLVSLEKIAAYTERLGSTLATSATGHAFFNGKHFDVNDDFLRHLQTEVGVQMQFLQEKVYEGSLSDATKGESMSNYFYDLPTSSKRRNRYIFPSNAAGRLRIVNLPELFGRARFRVSPPTYIYPPEFDSVSESLYIVADFDSVAGLDLIKEGLNSLNADSKTRVSFIYNPTSDSKGPENIPRGPASWVLSHLHIQGSLSKVTPATLLLALGADSDIAGDVDPLSEGFQIPLGKKDGYEALMEDGVHLDDLKMEEYVDYVKAGRLVARELGLAPGQSALVVNGRVVGPISGGDFRAADFKTLEEYEYRKRVQSVELALKEVAPLVLEDRYLFADIASMASSVIASTQQPDPSEVGLFDAPPKPRQKTYQLLDSNYTTFEFGDNSTALYHVAVLIDPLSATAQKWSGILKWLSNLPDIFIEIHLNPGRYTEVPLKRFYRYNLIPSLTFDEAGQEIQPKALFEDLPVDPIYTLAMDVPNAWLVRPREALYDLDNIQLGKLFPGDTSVEAVFELDYLTVEGHARETSTSSAPRGVQVQLATADGHPIDDTQVVANLGYFQFRAKPGVFQFEIRPGRGREIFKLDSAGNEGWDSPPVEVAGSEITVTSFEGLTLYPKFSRLPGMETADVLEEKQSEESKSFFEDISNRVMSIFKSPKKPEGPTGVIPVKPQAEINIFTVASGLLYERFVGIMILSVLRNTNSTVKFWFIENFLSPSFLEFIPHMAEKYNFQYELVTYKWPSWLRAQTEKQRIIWAYKILFLDVLFPMDLKKVIFVDADQIVRADLKELVDLDLQGAPYGYTPMGDDNTDMEGFRFWKAGYWKDFLRGKSYHISALYVIDLVRFRQLAAGDILRGQYQQLSADPNSLANLDQDLPNNLQDQVPIFSLGEDWLWCETWCSKDRLHRAKTIDLCQNPLTKEPKLARARQIPEWEEYDTEIAQFTRQLAKEGKIHSRMATADANVLAGAGNAATAGDDKPREIADAAVSESENTHAEKVEAASEPERDEL
ncbi:glycosyltransferase family 24 protein [Hebeloma cylindrosporum]|uniref:Glycosyltransferase family 24 protein n=1 Tax=Hebeloma cylindrosporum TaxID=76867 RepID=A0A0C3CD11_HEBCY|nr:glycosyltransferase family 24 protein [Hebeloma cylindrosporum h7]